MKMAIDTNRYRDFCGGLPDTVERFASADAIVLPFVTLAELRAGFQCGTVGKQNESVLQHDLLLYSRDAHFDHLPQIPRLN
ncbi:MAG: hypothetical protein K8T26_04085 [Lentisphaerae bacterium]|nr:hypothetical protein [Lentisphaerota bacterium]